MSETSKQETEPVDDYPDSWWYRVYLGVFVSAIVVMALLSWFTNYFSK
jgi:hypothetical protein